MTGRNNLPDPPDWALPSWDATDAAERTPAPAARRVPTSTGALGLRILAVSDVTKAVRESVRADERLRDLWVEGEVGRVTISSAGHAYFTLKDERSQLSCVFFRDDRVTSPFEPQAGLRIVAHGRVDVFDAQGVYQLYVSAIQPAGFGDLALRFEALKVKLAAEGLFDAARKRPLPVRPMTVAVVTSPSGAVWHDIQHVIRRRWPLTKVAFSPCQVQGDGSPQSIVHALNRVARWGAICRADNRPDDAPAVTILARGGGSLEDLWPFNDERVVRAVVAHPVPVVSGVGHEVDVTLADFAADVRAPTPSAAAELVTPDRLEVATGLGALERRLRSLVQAELADSLREVNEERRALDRLRPAAQLAQARERAGVLLDRATRSVATVLAEERRSLDRARGRLQPIAPLRLVRDNERLERAARLLPLLAEGRLGTARASLEGARAALSVLGPQATLDRGYAIVRRARDARIVRDPIETPSGEPLTVRVARGEFPATAGERGPAPGPPGGSSRGGGS